jgi:hypothetical protein
MQGFWRGSLVTIVIRNLSKVEYIKSLVKGPAIVKKSIETDALEIIYFSY